MLKNIESMLSGKLFKITVLIAVLILPIVTVFANPKLATKQQIGMFKNSRTCVVFESGIY
jgi:hypothetical protein